MWYKLNPYVRGRELLTPTMEEDGSYHSSMGSENSPDFHSVLITVFVRGISPSALPTLLKYLPLSSLRGTALLSPASLLHP